ncbi:hypothetical protein JCM10212_004738 [Sporobolomyces blumeae]
MPKSLYTLLPSIETLPLAYDPRFPSLDDQHRLDLSARLVQLGPARYALDDVLDDRALKDRQHLTYRHQWTRVKENRGEVDPDDPPSRPRRRGRPPSARSSTRKRLRFETDVERDDRAATTTGEQAADEDETGDTTTATTSASRRRRRPPRPRKHRREIATTDNGDRRARDDVLEWPRTHAVEVDVPQGFPPGPLLASVHDHASHLFVRTRNLLPPLTSSRPCLAPDLVQHFRQVEQVLNDEEEQVTLRDRIKVKELDEVKRTRVMTRGAGERKGAWTDAERAFESSALVAVGMLAQLLVEDAVNPVQPRPSPAPSSIE